MKKFLIIGATGHVGSALVDILLAQGNAVIAASRSGKNIGDATGLPFDLTAPQKLATDLKDLGKIDAAYLLLPTGFTQITEILLPIVDILADHKIKIVFQSVFGADASEDIPYRQVERAIEKSGTDFVFLRPNWFSDNFHIFWKQGILLGQIAVPAGSGKSSFIDVRDIAASAASALENAQFNGKAFNLTGPEALDYAQAAEIISKETGREISYQPLEDEAFIDMIITAGVPEDYARFLASIFYPVREGWTAEITEDVKTLTGQAPRTLQQYVVDNIDLLKA